MSEWLWDHAPHWIRRNFGFLWPTKIVYLDPDQRLDRYSGLIATMGNATAQGLTVHVATRATCAEHLEHGDDKATEPLTAAAFGLDTERLARALLAEARQRNRSEGRRVGYSSSYFTGQAERVAAEYARLKGETT